MSHDIPLSDEDVFEKLSPVEQVGSDRQALFESYGYTLRPRFRAGWVPSWRRDPSIQLFSAEDHLSSHVSGGCIICALKMPHVLFTSRCYDFILWMRREFQMASSFYSNE